MNTWDKVSLTWDCHSGLGTSITENGDFDAKVSQDFSGNRRHELLKMSAFSVYVDRGGQRCGVMTLRIKQSHNVDTAIEVIVDRLRSAFNKMTEGPNAFRQYSIGIDPPREKSWTDGKFTLTFGLADREQFCDQAIEIARAVLEALGIEDEKGYKLADFTLNRESFVMIDGSWITFVRWLRMSHRLPIFSMKDFLDEIR